MAKTLLEMLEAVLEQAAREGGHCFLTRMELHTRMDELIDTALHVGERSGRLVVRSDSSGDGGERYRERPLDRVYLPHLDAAERTCAENVKRLLVRT